MSKSRVRLYVQDLLQKRSNERFFIALLHEVDGPRQLPLLVGLLEAQAIALFMHDARPDRPMVHDLILGLAHAFSIDVKEVFIYQVKAGVFYSYLVCEREGQLVNVDARTSDALAIALRQGIPIYIDEELLNQQCMHEESDGVFSMPITVMNTEVLRDTLQQAIEREDYELAAHLRDVIKGREEEKLSAGIAHTTDVPDDALGNGNVRDEESASNNTSEPVDGPTDKPINQE